MYIYLFFPKTISFPNSTKKPQYQQKIFLKKDLIKNIQPSFFLLQPEHVSYLQDVVYNVSAPELVHPDPEMQIDQLHTCFQGEIINISGRYKVS